MGEIRLGDEVIGRDGRTHHVTGVFPQGIKPLYRVVFSDGSSTEVSDDHLWAVNTTTRRFRGNPDKVLPLSKIRQRLFYQNNNAIWFIPMVEPVHFQARSISIAPYLLGYCIANGNMTQHTVYLTIPDKETVDRLTPLFSAGSVLQAHKNDGIGYYVAGTNLRENLKRYGLHGHRAEAKFVPEDYLFNTLDVRLAVFQGLMDGDGSVAMADNHLEYSTASRSLADNVMFLVQSFGGTACINLKEEPKYTYQGQEKIGLPSYRVSIALPKGITPFLLARKADVYKERRKYQPTRAIVSVEPSGEAECQCISVDAEDHLYVTDNLVVTHNTIQALVSIPAHGKALVVCPATLKLNWRNEASVWRPDLKVVILKGSDSFRFPQAGELVITNYDILADFLDPTPKVKGQKKAPKTNWEQLKVWRVKLKEQHPEAEGTTVIFDEAHKVKNYKTERSRKVRELSRLSSSVWGLTGTPLDNEPSDLYGVLDSLDMAFDVFTPRKGQGSFRRFQELFAVQRSSWGGVRYGTPDPMVPELLRRVMLRRTRGEVMPDLPVKTYTNLVVGDMPEHIRQQLDELWESDGTAARSRWRFAAV